MVKWRLSGSINIASSLIEDNANLKPRKRPRRQHLEKGKDRIGKRKRVVAF